LYWPVAAIRFRRSHGLQGDEFNFGAHARAPDGMLYFGGTNGYNAFLPERLQFNNKSPQVVLTDVLKLNTPVTRTPERLQNLSLDFRDAAVTFRFAALDFTGPAENRYAYRLCRSGTGEPAAARIEHLGFADRPR
jgi:hypothetical protein